MVCLGSFVDIHVVVLFETDDVWFVCSSSEFYKYKQVVTLSEHVHSFYTIKMNALK